jgi:hypothetical protein
MTGRVKSFVRCGALVIAGGLLVAGGPACVTPPEGLKSVEGKEQEDIPVPKTLELERSYSPLAAEEANFRSWHGYYRGPGQFGDLPPWYVTEMRKHNWEFLGVEGSEWQKTLYFSKREESARIEIYRELDQHGGGYVNVVHAEIHPRGAEDLSLEEQLHSLKEGEVKPASFPAKDGGGQLTTAGKPPAEAGKGTPGRAGVSREAKSPGKAAAAAPPETKAPGTEVLDEIDRAEAESK